MDAGNREQGSGPTHWTRIHIQTLVILLPEPYTLHPVSPLA